MFDIYCLAIQVYSASYVPVEESAFWFVINNKFEWMFDLKMQF